MLRRLFIRDFVIVDKLELDFEAGFTALTGETGAGKSILIDALSLALGERGDGNVVRSGKDKAEVAAEFELLESSPLRSWLSEHDFDVGDTVLLRRVIDRNGRSKAYLNGAAATLGQLKAAADFLADIHGQHAHHSLLRADAQRQLVDSHGGLTGLAAEVGEAFRQWQQLKSLRENAERDAEAGRKEIELLEWQVKELEALAVDPEQWAADNQEHARLSHAASLISGVESSLEGLDGNEVSATALLDRLLGGLRHLVDIDATLQLPVELLEGARIQVAEAAHELNRYLQRLDLDPERLGQLESRIDSVMAVARKHRVAPEELAALSERCAVRLEDLRRHADPGLLAEQEARAQSQFLAAAKRLSAGRKKVAGQLSSEVSAAMQTLSMVGGRFEIALPAVGEGASFGLENVEFQVAANAGQGLRPLAKVASGGELSRIGLAIQVIASEAGDVPTLIFDEVDVGIGGGVAEIVGRLLARLGQHRQVLCVTHLPQVASQAVGQWSISKETREGETFSKVTPLNPDARVEEIARMLGGVKITETTRQHAREMLGY